MKKRKQPEDLEEKSSKKKKTDSDDVELIEKSSSHSTRSKSDTSQTRITSFTKKMDTKDSDKSKPTSSSPSKPTKEIASEISHDDASSKSSKREKKDKKTSEDDDVIEIIEVKEEAKKSTSKKSSLEKSKQDEPSKKSTKRKTGKKTPKSESESESEPKKSKKSKKVVKDKVMKGSESETSESEPKSSKNKKKASKKNKKTKSDDEEELKKTKSKKNKTSKSDDESETKTSKSKKSKTVVSENDSEEAKPKSSKMKTKPKKVVKSDDESEEETPKRKSRKPTSKTIVEETESEEENDKAPDVMDMMKNIEIPDWKSNIVSVSPISLENTTFVNISHKKKKFDINSFESAQITTSCWMMNLVTPIWALDWCPTKDSSFLAVAPHETDELHLAGTQYTGKTQIYILSFEVEPEIYSILNFEHGFVYSLKFVHVESENSDRLGILSVAFSDGTCGVYVVPKKQGSLVVSGYEYKNDTFPCTAVAWSHDLSHFTAGFGDGSCVMFKVDKEKILIPIYQNHVMKASVKSISWSATSKHFFMVSTLDQFVYLFDIREPWRVINQLRGGTAWTTAIEFPMGNSGCLMTSHEGEVKILEFDQEGGHTCRLTGDCPPIWDLSIAKTAPNVAYACSNGSVYFGKYLYPKRNHDYEITRIFGWKKQEGTIDVAFDDEAYEKKMESMENSINNVKFHPSMSNFMAFGGNQGVLVFLKNKQ